MKPHETNLTAPVYHVLAAALLAAALLAGCSTMTVKTDFDAQANFDKYKTYRWFKPKTGGPRLGQLLDKRIKLAVERELNARGMTRSAGRGADLLIRYHAGIKNKVEIAEDWYGWRQRRRAVSVYRYREGTIVLDFVDPQTRQLVWRGWAVGVIDDPGTAQQTIQEAIARIMEEYPPD